MPVSDTYKKDFKQVDLSKDTLYNLVNMAVSINFTGHLYFRDHHGHESS